LKLPRPVAGRLAANLDWRLFSCRYGRSWGGEPRPVRGRCSRPVELPAKATVFWAISSGLGGEASALPVTAPSPERATPSVVPTSLTV
jgi:hypothetical protein